MHMLFPVPPDFLGQRALAACGQRWHEGGSFLLTERRVVGWVEWGEWSCHAQGKDQNMTRKPPLTGAQY